MFRHVVLFRFDDGAADEAISTALGDVAALLGGHDAVRSAHVGRDVGSTSGNFDACVVADFDDEAGYVAYRDDPDHLALIKEQLAPMLTERAALQHELP